MEDLFDLSAILKLIQESSDICNISLTKATLMKIALFPPITSNFSKISISFSMLPREEAHFSKVV